MDKGICQECGASIAAFWTKCFDCRHKPRGSDQQKQAQRKPSPAAQSLSSEPYGKTGYAHERRDPQRSPLDVLGYWS